MTALGKTLVFLNLVAAVAVMAFISVAFTARTNWAAGYQEYKKSYEALNASYRAAQDEADKKASDADARVKEIEGERVKFAQALAQEKANHQKTNEARLAEQKKAQNETASKLALQADLQRRNDDVARLTNAAKERDKQILELVQQKNDLRDEKVQANIERDRHKVRVEQLASHLQELTREVERARKGGANGEATVTGPRENPPPVKVDGVIKQTDPSGLITISLGSDAGLTKGHTLDVYRLDPSAEFLGTVRLTDVRPNEAVGQLLKRSRTAVRVGDRVGTLNTKG